MPTAADFALAASNLQTALDELATARAPIDGIEDHGIHGGRLQDLVDRALDEQRHNLDGLGHALRYALEVAEYRKGVCEQYARDYAAWERSAAEWDRETREVGPNITRARPFPPGRPATWVQR